MEEKLGEVLIEQVAADVAEHVRRQAEMEKGGPLPAGSGTQPGGPTAAPGIVPVAAGLPGNGMVATPPAGLPTQPGMPVAPGVAIPGGAMATM